MRTPTLLASLSLAAALSLAACSSDPWDDPAIGDPFVPDPTTARRIGRLLEDATPRLVAGSGAASARAADRTVWLLGDVTLGFGTRRVVTSSAVISHPGDEWPGSEGSELLTQATPGEEEEGGTVRRWLSAMPVGDDILLHYAVTRSGAAGEPALDYLGTGVARLAPDALAVSEPGGDWRFFDRGDPAFGVAVVQAQHGITTGFDYIYGIRGDAATHRVYVARVPHGLGDERDQYRFFAGSAEWSEDVDDAVPLFRAGPQGMSVSWNNHMQAFLAVYSWTVPGSGSEPDRIRVLARASRQPEGPWSPETPLFEVRGPAVTGRVRFDAGAREHPSLAQYDGRILHVTVDGGSGPDPAEIRAPRMWRVEFPETR